MVHQATWQAWPAQDLEAQFNPRMSLGGRVPEILAGWAAAAERRRGELPGPFDVAYGSHPKARLDVHVRRDAPKATLVVFIHGGYWRALDKSDCDHCIASLYSQGFHVVSINYPLCPEVSVTEINSGLVDALRLIVKQMPAWGIMRQTFFLMGHSVGAHAVVWLASKREFVPKIAGVIPVTGIYEVAVVRSISVQNDVRLTESEATQFDLCENLPERGLPYFVTVGDMEPPGWIEQSRELTKLLKLQGDDASLGLVENADHFSIMERLCTSGDVWNERLHEWIQRHDIAASRL